MSRSVGACTLSVIIICSNAADAVAQAESTGFTRAAAAEKEFTRARPVAVDAAEAASADVADALATGTQAYTPEGRAVPVYRVERSAQTAAPSPVGSGVDDEFVLFQATAARYYGTADWYQVWDLATLGPYAISYVSAFAGDTGNTAIYCSTDRYHLLELYDAHYCSGDVCAPECGNAIHGGYLGGLLVNLGPHDPADPICGGTSGSNQDFFRWTVQAGPAPATFPLSTPTDGRVVAVHRLGTLSGGVFVPVPARSDDTGLSLIHASLGGATVTAGGVVAGTWFSDGYGGGNESDRIYEPEDGPLVLSGKYEAVLDCEIRGRYRHDCNDNGYPDEWEMTCYENPEAGPACRAYECAFYHDLNTTGAMWNDPHFSNPLVAAGCEDGCIPGSFATCGECNTNGVPDVCDLSCDNFFGFDLCSVLFPGECGTGTDCDRNGVIDECQLPGHDCNANGVLDFCDIASDTSADCNANRQPDECEIASGAVDDCDSNGVPDRCERPEYYDCNGNALEDYCDILSGQSGDLNGDGVPDECPDRCVQLFEAPVGGFEDAAYVPGSLDGVDPNGDGEAWSVYGGWSVEAGSFPAVPPVVGGGSKRIRGAGANSPDGFPNFMFSENFFGPAPHPLVRRETLSFDYRIVGTPTGAAHDLHFQLGDYNDANNAVIVRWTSTVSDLGTNGAVPGHIWLLVGDGSGDVQCYDTGVAVDNAAHRMTMEVDFGAQRVTVLHDDAVVATDLPTFEYVQRLDEFGAGSRTFHAPAGAGFMDLQLDNFEWCQLGAALSCADIDRDGDVDLTDYHQLQLCAAGSAAACGCADADNDGDVDAYDVGVFVGELTGPN
ncbi:MAG TPA: hypothetical protein P5572_06255 [Phycisphaerae bacterium]|nr:hypothetical protein [Phycisphaerae bacterium]